MTPFSMFSFSQTKSRRKTLFDVMPIKPDLDYVVILTGAYFNKAGVDTYISGFNDLCNVVGIDDGLRALYSARSKGQLSEKQHMLSSALASYLSNLGTGDLHFRRWIFGISTPILHSSPLADVRDAWSKLNFEEVEVCDSSATWYFRARDDDPLIFLALPKGTFSKVADQFRDCCRLVNGDFKYAA